MSFVWCVVVIAFVHGVTGFIGLPATLRSSGRFTNNLSNGLMIRTRLLVTWPGRVSPLRSSSLETRGSCERLCMTAETGEQEQLQQEEQQEPATPRLKRTRRRRKDGSLSTAEEESKTLTTESFPNAGPDLSIPTDPTSLTQATQSPDSTTATQEMVGTERTEAFLPSGQESTKGKKVRIGDDSGDDMAERLADTATAVSDAVGSAASALRGVASSTVDGALSAFGKGSSSTMYGSNADVESVDAPRKSGPNLEELGEDIARFRMRETRDRQRDKDDDSGFALGARDVISTIITVDFFVVIGFLLWFIAGVVSRYGWNDSFLLDEFNASWNPIVQPALGLLMGGTIAGGVVSRLRSSGDDSSER